MLFDLRARGRRRTVQGIYLMLAVLMGGGLVLFGIGGATSGGLLDALKGGGSSTSSQVDKNVKAAQKRVKLHPRDATAWAALARSEYQLAGQGENYDQSTGAFTDKGKAELRKVATAWNRYLALDPKHPDPNLAAQMVQAFGPAGLGRYADATTAQEIVVDSESPSAALYARLAVFAYAAGQTRKGDLSAQKAVALAPKAQRQTLKAQLQAAKTSPQQALGTG
jgi:hypothetical protein